MKQISIKLLGLDTIPIFIEITRPDNNSFKNCQFEWFFAEKLYRESFSFKGLNYFYRKLLVIALLLLTLTVNGQSKNLSPETDISVLTIGPGVSLNDAFGHNAFRIKAPIKGTDLVFNYGVYDFDTPNF